MKLEVEGLNPTWGKNLFDEYINALYQSLGCYVYTRIYTCCLVSMAIGVNCLKHFIYLWNNEADKPLDMKVVVVAHILQHHQRSCHL